MQEYCFLTLPTKAVRRATDLQFLSLTNQCGDSLVLYQEWVPPPFMLLALVPNNCFFFIVVVGGHAVH